MTATTDTGDFDAVLGDPAAFFATPQAILDDPTLSLAEMAHLLTEWQQDIEDRRSAAAEGMVADQPQLTDADMRLGDGVVEARAALALRTEANGDLAGLPLRLWRRLTGTAA